MENDSKNFLESGVAKTQIEAARRRLASGESLEELQKQNISYLNEMITGIILVLFLVFLIAYLFFGADTFIVLSMLLISTSILIFQTAKSLQIKLRVRSARKEELKKYGK